jgi:hypothetical protein
VEEGVVEDEEGACIEEEPEKMGLDEAESEDIVTAVVLAAAAVVAVAVAVEVEKARENKKQGQARNDARRTVTIRRL